MPIRKYIGQLNAQLRLIKFRLENFSKVKFTCPICGYRGPFQNVSPPTGLRIHAKCPNCAALERHRLQYLVVTKVFDNIKIGHLKMIHFAPEKFFTKIFYEMFGQYETADLDRKDVDHRVDLQELPFEDAVYDVVFASHVLEHVPKVIEAVSEIRRIMKPGGIAILPVPLVSEKTIEYDEPNPNESYHVRAPGLDFFERYKPYFSQIKNYSSESMPAKYQLYIYEDRSHWPTKECPQRPPMAGDKHVDIVPVCYA